MQISDFLKSARIKKGISQKELAEKLGIKQSTYSQYETGRRKPKSTTFNKILDALCLSAPDLADLTFQEDDFKNSSEWKEHLYHRADIEQERENRLSIIFQLLKSDSAWNYSHGIFVQNREIELLEYFWQLNSLGQSTAIERLEELAEIIKYTKPDPPESDGSDASPLMSDQTAAKAPEDVDPDHKED